MLNTVSIGKDPQDVAIGAGSLWIADVEAGAVFRVDPLTLTPLAKIPVPQAARAIFAFGSV